MGERRQKQRILKIEEEKMKYKERQEESYKKLNRPALKKIGKPNMFRSNPPQKKVKEEVVEKNDETLEIKKYF